MEPRDCTCSDCGEKFTKFANLKRHQQRVHEGVKVACEVCSKLVSNIDKHRRVHRAREEKAKGAQPVLRRPQGKEL